MKWIEIANWIGPIVGMIYPAARELAPTVLQAINDAQRAYPDENASREAKRADVIGSVVISETAKREAAGAPPDVGQLIAVVQAIFQLIDTIHTIVKAQQVDAAPAPAVKP